MSIEVLIRHRQGSFTLDVAFESHGSLTALSGASGSGKTSVINVIAGLVRPNHGRISVNGDILLDTEKGISRPAHLRRIGYVFQDARLFPHLTVAQNLNFGRWFTPREGRYASESQVLELLGIGHLLRRRPGALSGGEKQRVAIGRALLASPRLLLMDEPLASLDDARKAEILPYVERLRDEFKVPIVYVSHSIAEVTRLATDIVLLNEGRVAASGPAADIVQRLDLIPSEERDEGGTLLDMAITGYDESFDMTELKSTAGTAHVPGRIGGKGTLVRVRIRARDVMIATSELKNISALNIFSGTVGAISPAGRASVNVRLECGGTPVLARITRQSCEALGLREGTKAYAVLKAVSVAAPGAVPLAGQEAGT